MKGRVKEAALGAKRNTETPQWGMQQASTHLLACPITFHLEFCVCRSEKDPEEETVKP